MAEAVEAEGLDRADRLWTVPNAISLLRLALVPVFVLLIVRHHDGWAIVVLAFSGITDWLDGFAARRLHQYSKWGRLLDPTADRLFLLVTVFGLLWRGTIPWWLVVLLVVREAVMGVTLLVLKSRGISTPEVVFVGKAATLALMYAFPLLLLGSWGNWVGWTAWTFGWAFAIWGVVLYWVACGAYLIEARRALALAAAAGRAGLDGPQP
ncbi:MAG: CDP-alcohol phosphatidyltransferase family protein [Bifidobacteriaceae bacterium]|jgi:cardiolipin synthase|nr:CDP-alcohol phosphatidyltransferase family protein [Bifidobacteriaceae bacterium]